MLKVIEYVRDALPAVGKFVMIDGYTGRLAVAKGLDPDDHPITGDFQVFSHNAATKVVTREVPLFPSTVGQGAYPILLSGLDLSESEVDPDSICTPAELTTLSSGYYFNFFGADDDDEESEEEEAPVKKEVEKKDKGPTEGELLMEFFFSKRKKVVKKEEEREKWGTDGFEFF
jgi:hypothetical protein